MTATEREMQVKIIANKDAIIAQLEAEIRALNDKLEQIRVIASNL